MLEAEGGRLHRQQPQAFWGKPLSLGKQGDPRNRRPAQMAHLARDRREP